MKRYSSVILLAFLFVLLAFQGPLYGADIRESTLANGLKVLMIEDHKAPLAVFQIWYRIGSRDEVSGKTGLSHLLEHMMFKGTEKYGSKELSVEVKRHGGMDNAFTSKDYTAYFQVLPSDKIELSLKFESDRMRNLLLDPEETLSERDVVMEERRLRTEDDPQGLLYELTVATAFTAHPYRSPVIGWMDDLRNITPEDLKEHYRAFYSPDNAFIVVVGDIKPESLLDKIREYFEDIEPTPRPRRNATEEPRQQGERRVYLKKEAQLPYILAAYHVPNIPDPDAYALDILSMVLSEKSGRLYQKLVYEKKIAIGVFSEYSGMFKDPYLLILGGTATPGTAISAVEEALYREIDRIKEEPPSDFEVQKAKNQLEAYFISTQDSILSQANLTARFEILGGTGIMDEYLENILQITPEDVSRVARKYLVEENRTMGILEPQPPTEAPREKANENP